MNCRSFRNSVSVNTFQTQFTRQSGVRHHKNSVYTNPNSSLVVYDKQSSEVVQHIHRYAVAIIINVRCADYFFQHRNKSLSGQWTSADTADGLDDMGTVPMQY